MKYRIYQTSHGFELWCRKMDLHGFQYIQSFDTLIEAIRAAGPNAEFDQ